MYVHTYVYTHTCIYTYMYVCVYVCVCVRISQYMYMGRPKIKQNYLLEDGPLIVQASPT